MIKRVSKPPLGLHFVNGRGRVALVVEDSPEFQAAITHALSQTGEQWALQVADTGKEALALLAGRALRPDLALIDLGLPDMSGVAVIRAARNRYPKLPIMVVSILDSSDHVLAAIRAGARGYLYKGDSIVALAEGIQHVLAGGHAISPSLARYLFNLVQAEPLESGEAGSLSPREAQLLRLLGQGFTYDEAAERMGVSLPTAKTFSRRIYQKLQVNSKVKAIVAARERGLI